jgi:hypothetical protein
MTDPTTEPVAVPLAGNDARDYEDEAYVEGVRDLARMIVADKTANWKAVSGVLCDCADLIERHARHRLTHADEVEQALLDIERVLQSTPERDGFCDELAQQQDQALIEIHEISQQALAAIRARPAVPDQ